MICLPGWKRVTDKPAGNFLKSSPDTLVPLFPAGAVLPIGADGNIDFAAPAGVISFPEGVWGEPVQKDKETGLELAGLCQGFATHRLRSALGYRYLREKAEEYKNFGPGILDGSQLVQGGALIDVTSTDTSISPIIPGRLSTAPCRTNGGWPKIGNWSPGCATIIILISATRSTRAWPWSGRPGTI